MEKVMTAKYDQEISQATKGILLRKLYDSYSSYIKLCFTNMVILFMVFGGFYRSIFANGDTLWGAISPDDTFRARLENYRWLSAVFEGIFNKTGFLPALHLRPSLIFLIFSFALSLTLLQIAFWPLFFDVDFKEFSFRKHFSLRVHIYRLAFTVAFLNVLNCEFFYYTESMHIFAMSFIFMALGVYLYSKERYITGLIAFCMVSVTYQVTCLTAVIVMISYVYFYYKGHMDKRMFCRALFYAGTPSALFLLNYMTGPWILAVLNRMGFGGNPAKEVLVTMSPSELIRAYTGQLHDAFASSLNLTPELHLPLILLLAAALLVTCVSIKRGRIADIFTFLLYLLVMILCSFSLQIFVHPENFEVRLITPFTFMQAMLLLVLIFYSDASLLRNWVETASYALVIITVCFNAFFIQCVIENRLLSESLDYIYAEQIFDYIRDYELGTGNTVDEMAVVVDKNSKDFYSRVFFNKSTVNKRCYDRYTWAFLQYCSSFTSIAGSLEGRQYKHVDMDDKLYQECFEGRDWKEFELKEQVVFSGNRVNICVF